MNFFDAHNHLQDGALRPYRDAIVTACARLPVTRMVVNGTTEADWPEVASLAGRLPFVLPSFGLHPWHLRSRTDHWTERLRELLEQYPKATVGEFGLDRWMQDYDIDDQIAVFRTHLEIAVEFGRPATIHCLRAWDDLRGLLERSTLPPSGFLVHAYGGPINHPANIRAVHQGLAELRGLDLDELSARVAANFERLFGIPLEGV